MADTTRCKTVLVDDNPVGKDQFSSDSETGPHLRVANAIGELIEHGERGGKVIGLEGRWGAGKSTVVTMLRQAFEGNPHIAVLAFDAWAHEGEPLRRTYLEALIAPLKTRGWINDRKWSERLEELARRRKVTDTKIIPKATTLGTVFALSLIAVPIGTTFVAAAFREGVTLSFGGEPAWQFLFGLALALSPFWVLLVKALRVIVRRRFVWPWFVDEDWVFLAGHSLVRQRLETVESPEPTSIEFENDFSDLMSEAIGANGERSVLLILDNLDRVDAETALQLWSTLQTFLQERQYRQGGWFSRLWILVPYDPKGLKRQWGGRNTKEGRELAESFFEKSFQVRFHVPPPILSSWKAYLLGLLRLALPEHAEIELMPVCSVYDRFRPCPRRFPTPRELKVFVNQVAAIHLQWQHEFHLEHVAYFALNFSDHATMIEELREGLSPEVRRTFGDDLVEALAGLTFNVPASRAMELLLSAPIQHALETGNGAELTELERGHGRGFWAVLAQQASAVVDLADPHHVARYASACQRSGLFASQAPQEAVAMAAALARSVSFIREWPVGTPKEAEEFVDLCAFVKQPGLAEKAVASLRLGVATEDNKGEASPAEFAAACCALFDGLSGLGYQDALPASVAMPGDLDYWTAFSGELARRDSSGTWWSRFRPSFNGKEFAKSIATTVTEGRWVESHLSAALISHAAGIVPDWTGVFTSVGERLNAALSVAPEEAEQLILLINAARKRGIPDSERVAKELADNGHLLHHLHTLRKKEEARAVCLFLYLRERPNAESPPAVGNSNAGHEWVQKSLQDEALGAAFAGYLAQARALSVLWQVIAARGQVEPMLRGALSHIVLAGNATELFEPRGVLENWTALESGFNAEEQRLEALGRMLDLAIKGGLCSLLMNDSEGFRVERATIYRAVVSRATATDTGFQRWLTEQARSMSKEVWATELAVDGPLLGLALELQRRGMLPSLSTSFLDALSGAAMKTASKEASFEAVRTRWGGVIGLIPSGSQRAELADAALRAVITQGGKVSTEYWDSFGTLIDAGVVRRKDRVIADLFVPIVRDRDEPGMLWFRGLCASPGIADFLRAQPDFDALEARLRDCIGQLGGDPQHTAITEIAGALGVKGALDPDDGNSPGEGGRADVS